MNFLDVSKARFSTYAVRINVNFVLLVCPLCHFSLPYLACVFAGECSVEDDRSHWQTYRFLAKTLLSQCQPPQPHPPPPPPARPIILRRKDCSAALTASDASVSRAKKVPLRPICRAALDICVCVCVSPFSFEGLACAADHAGPV